MNKQVIPLFQDPAESEESPRYSDYSTPFRGGIKESGKKTAAKKKTPEQQIAAYAGAISRFLDLAGCTIDASLHPDKTAAEFEAFQAWMARKARTARR